MVETRFHVELSVLHHTAQPSTHSSALGTAGAHKAIKGHIEWTEEEKKELEEVKNNMNSIQKTYRKGCIEAREEKRLLLNRTAKEKGWHIYGAYKYEKKRITTTCRLCGNVADVGKTPKNPAMGLTLDINELKTACKENQQEKDEGYEQEAIKEDIKRRKKKKLGPR